MSALSGSPRVERGALVALDPLRPAGSVIVFQYNPHQVTRTLTPQAHGGNAAPAEAQRLLGPPQETIKLEVELDATDQLERSDPTAARTGILPQLSALEVLLYPASAQVLANEVLLRLGTIEVVPPESPLTVLVWGAQRVVPVRLTEFAVTEEMFDPALHPIHAKVTLGLRVLSYRDLGLASPGGGLFLAHQLQKEALALRGSIAGAASFLASLPPA